MVWGPDWEFSQDTGVKTPTLTISAMWSLMTSESQDTHLMSHPKDSNLHRAVSPITALGNWDIYFFRSEERVPPTGGPPTPLPAASGLPSRNWPVPTLLSFRSKPAVVCRVVCCWRIYELCLHCMKNALYTNLWNKLTEERKKLLTLKKPLQPSQVRTP